MGALMVEVVAVAGDGLISACWSGDFCLLNSLLLPMVSSRGAPPQMEGDRSSSAPQRGGFQKQRTLSRGVYTSLYKIIKSSINMQLYTEPNPSLGWPGELRGRDGGEGRAMSHWGQMRVEVGCPGDHQP